MFFTIKLYLYLNWVLILNWIAWDRTIFIKMDLALNNLQRLICHKPNYIYIYIYICLKNKEVRNSIPFPYIYIYIYIYTRGSFNKLRRFLPKEFAIENNFYRFTSFKETFSYGSFPVPDEFARDFFFTEELTFFVESVCISNL